jgi:hypothetical protein
MQFKGCSTVNPCKFSKDNFNDIRNQAGASVPIFKFQSVSYCDVEYLINDLDNTSGAGISGISPKILKKLNAKLFPLLTNIFNECIKSNSIPNEWKTAIVTPL